jgi:transcriptional regulator with XRE-family HTH domain
MKGYGAFLSNLRSSVSLSLEELARLLGISKSTLSRLENDDIAQPFKGTMRKLESFRSAKTPFSERGRL